MSDTTQQSAEKKLNSVYWERNQLIIALTKIFPAYLAKHDENDKDWESDWRTIVVVELPQKLILKQDEIEIAEYYMGMHMPPSYKNQLTWHIHDSEIGYFDHLKYFDGYTWDGHTTEEKYRRLRKIPQLDIEYLNKIQYGFGSLQSEKALQQLCVDKNDNN